MLCIVDACSYQPSGQNNSGQNKAPEPGGVRTIIRTHYKCPLKVLAQVPGEGLWISGSAPFLAKSIQG